MVVVRRAHVHSVLRPGGAFRACRACYASVTRHHSRLSPFRAQTCNFDTLYAYLSARLRLEPRTQRTFPPRLVSHLLFPSARSVRQLRLQREPHPLKHRTSFAILAHADAVPVLAQYDRSKNLRPKRNIRTAMNHEIMMYGEHSASEAAQQSFPCLVRRADLLPLLFPGIAQKEQLGFDVRTTPLNPHRPCPFSRTPVDHRLPLRAQKAVEECKYRAFHCRVEPFERLSHASTHPAPVCCAGMSRYGVTPNMLILPPQMLLYMALAPEERLT